MTRRIDWPAVLAVAAYALFIIALMSGGTSS